MAFVVELDNGHAFLCDRPAFETLTDAEHLFVVQTKTLVEQSIAGMLAVARQHIEPAAATQASPKTKRLIAFVLKHAADEIFRIAQEEEKHESGQEPRHND